MFPTLVRLLLRRLRSALRRHLTGTTRTTAAVHHLFVLLLLIGIQDGLDLDRGFLPDLDHLAHAVLL